VDFFFGDIGFGAEVIAGGIKLELLGMIGNRGVGIGAGFEQGRDQVGAVSGNGPDEEFRSSLFDQVIYGLVVAFREGLSQFGGERLNCVFGRVGFGFCVDGAEDVEDGVWIDDGLTFPTWHTDLPQMKETINIAGNFGQLFLVRIADPTRGRSACWV